MNYRTVTASTNRIVNNMWNGVMTLNLSTITETNGSIARGLTRADIYNSRENNFNPAAKPSRPSPRINPTGGGLKSNRKMYY